MTKPAEETEKVMLHIRVEAEHAAQLDALKAKLHFGSRSTAVSVGMPALLAFLEKIAKDREDVTS